MKKVILIACFTFFTAQLHAQSPGDLDTTFGANGYVLNNPYQNVDEYIADMIVLADDKIVQVGHRVNASGKDVLVAKFKANGEADSSFGTNGFITLDLSLGGDEEGKAIVELSNGKFLIAGQIENVASTDGFVARLNADGSLDNSFGTSNGHSKFNTGDNTVAVGTCLALSGSEFFVAGSANVNNQADAIIVNFTQGGGIDVSFASSGFATMDIHGKDDIVNTMDIKSNGAFVFGGVADSANANIPTGFVASLSQFGTPTTFGTNGAYTFNMGVGGLTNVNSLYVDANDRIVLTGEGGLYPNIDGFIRRLTPGGVLDNTFATNGIVPSDPGATTALRLSKVMETPNGDIVALGCFQAASNDLYALMVTGNGSFNTNFGGNGDVIIPFNTVTNTATLTTTGGLQSNGAILMGGQLASPSFDASNLFTVRLHPYNCSNALGDITKREQLLIYPNPIKNAFKMDIDNLQSVQLISLDGRIMKNWKVATEYVLPEGLAAGMYFVGAYSKGTLYSGKIVVE